MAVSLVLTGVPLGCDSSAIDEEPDRPPVCTAGPDHGSLWPLSVGNYWSFEYYWRGALTDTLRVVVEEEYAAGRFARGITFLVHRYGLSEALPAKKELWTNSERGPTQVGFISRGDTVDYLPHFRFPYPARRWEEFYSYNFTRDLRTDGPWEVADSSRYVVVATDEQTATVLGRFRSHVYRHLDRPLDDAFGDSVYVSYAPGHGLVGISAYNERQGRTRDPNWQFKLVDICIKKRAP